MQKVLVLLLLLSTGTLAYMVYQREHKVLPGVKPLQVDSTAGVAKTKGKMRKRGKFVNLHIDSIAVHKAKRELLAFSKNNLVRSYPIALGINPVGKKEVEGDYKTPEGLYHIRGKNPFSTYHKSLGISYPNDEDREHARTLGRSPGGDIMIHGLMKNMNNPGKSHIKSDWTFGCIAITNEEIDELYAQVKVGTPVMITP